MRGCKDMLGSVAARWRTLALATVFAGGSLFTAAPAVAQNQLGDGRLLDNNLQQGSGGVNAPRRANPYGRYSDAVVTGNVGGLGAFRDQVGYRAPGEFTDVTGADDTFGFRRSALPQSVRVGPEGRPQGAMRNPQFDPARVEGTVLMRGGTGPDAGQVTGRVRQYPHSFRIDDDARDAAGRALAPDRRRDELVRDQLSVGPARAGLLADDRGQLLQVTTSPLTGVRQQVIGEMRLPEIEIEDEPLLDERELEERRIREEIDARRRGLIDGTAFRRPQDEPRVARPERIDQRPIDGRQTDLLTETMARLERAGRIDPGEDAYLDLLREIDRRLPTTLPLGSRQRPLRGEDAEPSRVDELAEEFQRLERGEPLDDEDELEPIDRLARGLTYDLPPVDSFAGSADTRLNRLLAQAESLMEDGRYFQAESMYGRVLAMEPEYAIAEIGRIHAQLGAGMYLTAASRLRHTLGTHPQLIAARYTGAVMPDAERLRAIDRELEELAQSDPEAAALLQSYLAYQRDHPEELDVALGRLEQAADDHDTLPALLRRIWLNAAEEEPGAADAPGDADRPAPDDLLDAPDDGADDTTPDADDPAVP